MSSRWFWIRRAHDFAMRRLRGELQQQDIPRDPGHRRRAGRVSGPVHGLFHLLRGNRQIVGRRQLFQRHRMKVIILVQTAQPTRVGDIRNHMTHEPFDIRCEIEKGELFSQIILKRLRPRRHVLLEVVPPIPFLVDAVAARAMLFIEMVEPVLVDLVESVKVFFTVAVAVDDQFLPCFRCFVAFFRDFFDRLIRRCFILLRIS